MKAGGSSEITAVCATERKSNSTNHSTVHNFIDCMSTWSFPFKLIFVPLSLPPPVISDENLPHYADDTPLCTSIRIW